MFSDVYPRDFRAWLFASSVLSGKTLRSLAAAAGIVTAFGGAPGWAACLSTNVGFTGTCAATTAAGFNATAVGQNAVAAGDFATAYGDSANATGDAATATGHASHAAGLQATATGQNANATARHRDRNGQQQQRDRRRGNCNGPGRQR